ncbi:transmembrane protein 26-like [Styela clava]|uniref:transmembrane protein 26-like n=1 Tax=Styela clava TaxID=7725 RepID=UPI001939BAE6|nr:transmembrane protein 26-like [Styela clava]
MSLLIIFKAISVRVIYFIYCFIGIWRVVETYGNSNYWWMLALLLGILFETLLTFYRRGGREWKWFSPAIFFYMAATLPCIWLLELHLMGLRHKELDAIANKTRVDKTHSLLGLTIEIDFDEFGWALALEQTMFCILILSRWVLPRGEISRNQLSQLLLVHVGMAADIMELFEVFEEEKIVEYPNLIYPTLSLWSWSLLQYCFVITNTNARKDRFGGTEEDENEAVDGKVARCTCHISDWNADVVGIFTTILMQDLPFFIFRVFLLGGVGILSHMMVFFTCKNALVIMLQLYRLVSIYLEKNHSDEPEEISNVPTVSDPEQGRSDKNHVGPKPQNLEINTNNNAVLPSAIPSPALENENLRHSKNAFQDFEDYGALND